MWLWAAAVAALAVAGLALWQRGRRRAHLVLLADRVPGPPAFPLVGSVASLLGKPREDLFAALNKLSWQYWPIMRFWKGPIPEFHLMRAEDVEVILSSTTHIDKSIAYDFVRPWLGDGLLTSTGRKWHSRRKLITPTFHFRILESFLDVFVERSNALADALGRELGSADGFDVFPYVTLCALDIICETAMGTQINAQGDAHSEYVKAIYNITESLIQRTFRPWLYPDFIYYRSSRGKANKRDLSILHGFTNKVIQERKLSAQKQGDLRDKNEEEAFGVKRRLAFLDLLLEASKGGTVLSDEDIREEVDTFMFAGHDTTSVGISWVLLMLGSYPDVQEKVAEELQEIFQGSDRAPTMKDLAEMKYLERVIKETLRLYPSVPNIGRHVHEDIQIGEYKLPAGCNIAVRIYLVHRNPEYFPEPEKFNPDNFLPERVQGRHPYAYIPFSAGSRNCMGQKFAMLEEKTVISTLVRRYSFQALDKVEDLKLLSEIVLRSSNGIRLKIQRRSQHQKSGSMI